MTGLINWRADKVPKFTVGDWEVDPDRYRLRHDGDEVRLEPKVMETLVYLASHAGETVTRDELEKNIWAGTVVGYYSLTGTMLKLRKAFNDDSKNPRVIETLSKKGYRLIADIDVLPDVQTIPDVASKAREVEAGDVRVQQEITRYINKPWLIISLVVLVLGLLGFLLLTEAYKFTSSYESAGKKNVVSIAVLPFENRSANKSTEYFVDGITHDLITDLTRIAELLVISRDSTFGYKGKTTDIQSIAEQLNVRYVLNGNLRRVGDQVRINVYLVDSSTGSQLWAQRYDSELKNIFSLQDKITASIVAALKVNLTHKQSQYVGHQYTKNIEAYETFLRGREAAHQYSRAGTEEARKLLLKTIQLDPNFAEAYAWLGWTYSYALMNGWGYDMTYLETQALKFADKAITLHERLPIAYFVKGLIYRHQKKYEHALIEAERAIAIDPNYANAHVLVATLLYYAGRAEEGLQRMKQAIRVNPHHPHNYPFHLGQAYFVLKRYDEAINAFEKGLESRPHSQRIRIWLAAAYAQSGRVNDAKWEAEQLLLLDPEITDDRLYDIFPFKETADLAHFLEGLKKAGLTN